LESGKDKAKDVKKEGEKALEAGKENVKEGSKDVKKEGERILESGKDKAKDVKKEGEKALGAGKEKAEGALKAGEKSLEKGKEKVKEGSKDVKKEGEKALEKGKEVVREASKSGEQLWEQTKKKTNSAYVEGQDALGEVSDKVGGTLKESYGGLTGDKQLEKAGKAQRKKGSDDLDRRWRSYSEQDLRKKPKEKAKEYDEETDSSSRRKIQKKKRKSQADDYEDFEPSPMAGFTDKFVGTLKEGVGKLIGSDDWVEEGERQKERGNAELYAAKKRLKKSKDRD